MNKIGNLYIMIGIPGSGKSTRAQELAKETNGIVHSSDDIREELANAKNLDGGAGNQTVSNDAFEIMYQRTVDDLKQGKTVIYDATNISRMGREKLISSLRELDIEFNAYYEWVNTELEVCKERNLSRYEQQINEGVEHPCFVPEKVIENMYRRLERPYQYEGYSDNTEMAATLEPGTEPIDVISQMRKNEYKSHFKRLIKLRAAGITNNQIEDMLSIIDDKLEKNKYLNLSLLLYTIGNKNTDFEKANRIIDNIEYLNESYKQLSFNDFNYVYKEFVKTDMDLESLKSLILIKDSNAWYKINSTIMNTKNTIDDIINDNTLPNNSQTSPSIDDSLIL